MKSRGPSTEPWGTPHEQVWREDMWLSHLTWKERISRNRQVTYREVKEMWETFFACKSVCQWLDIRVWSLDKDGYSQVRKYNNSKKWIVMIFGQKKWVFIEDYAEIESTVGAGWFRLDSCEIWLIVAWVQWEEIRLLMCSVLVILITVFIIFVVKSLWWTTTSWHAGQHYVQ